MFRTSSQFANRWLGRWMKHCLALRSAVSGRRLRAYLLACVPSVLPTVLLPVSAVGGPYVEFDLAPTAECRDVTPPERIKQYPNQRLIEVALPVSVRFRGLSMEEVEELAIEVDGSSAGFRVADFAPQTQLASEITKEIESTTTSKKTRSLDGTLGGTLPIPGADAAAHITPSITAGLSGCDTETEKVNRLPPKHAVVVSGTSSAGRAVFFKLKRYSQTSLEGVHELSVTFVAPRAWKWSEIRVDCAARGEQKMLWMRQSGIIGQANRMVQLVEASAKPIRQVVLKPADNEPPAAKPAPKTDKPAAPTAPTAEQWRALLHEAISAEVTDQLSEPMSASKKRATSTATDKGL